MIELGSRQEVVINDLTFYIQHMDPFTALHTLGELQKLASPLIGEMAGSFEQQAKDTDGDILDQDLSDVAQFTSAIKGVFMSAHKYIDGDNLVRVLRLLLQDKYISVEYNGRKQALNDDMIRFVFNGDMLGMLELAYHVLRINYADFFIKSVNRFGDLTNNAKVLSFAGK